MKSDSELPNALIVEDDLNQAKILQVWLTSVGYFATIAKDLSEAEEVIRAIPNLQMITLDLNLPDSRALSTIERIREIRKANPTAYLLVISGVLTTVDASRAIEYGATAVIEKHEILNEKNFMGKLWGIFSIRKLSSPSDALLSALSDRLQKKCEELNTPPSEPTANA